MSDDDPKIIVSPLSRRYSSDGTTVSVEIYRLEGSQGWSLELVDADSNSTVWEDTFPTDQAAFDVFLLGVKTVGLSKLLEPDDDEPSMITIH